MRYLILPLLVAQMIQVETLRCYKCRSDEDNNCASHPSSDYLVECDPVQKPRAKRALSNIAVKDAFWKTIDNEKFVEKSEEKYLKAINRKFADNEIAKRSKENNLKNDKNNLKEGTKNENKKSAFDSSLNFDKLEDKIVEGKVSYFNEKDDKELNDFFDKKKVSSPSAEFSTLNYGEFSESNQDQTIAGWDVKDDSHTKMDTQRSNLDQVSNPESAFDDATLDQSHYGNYIRSNENQNVYFPNQNFRNLVDGNTFGQSSSEKAASFETVTVFEESDPPDLEREKFENQFERQKETKAPTTKASTTQPTTSKAPASEPPGGAGPAPSDVERIPVCRKVHQFVYLKPQIESVVRECGYKIPNEKIRCHLEHWVEMDVTHCDCDKDGCNSSKRLLSSVNWMFLMVYLILRSVST